MTFDILWRRTGRADVTLAEWNHHFDPKAGGDFTATPLEVSADGPAVDFQDGDQLVFKYSGTNTTVNEAYIPDGDGVRENGRDPYIDLPQ